MNSAVGFEERAEPPEHPLIRRPVKRSETNHTPETARTWSQLKRGPFAGMFRVPETRGSTNLPARRNKMNRTVATAVALFLVPSGMRYAPEARC